MCHGVTGCDLCCTQQVQSILQVPVDPLLPEAQSAPGAPDSQPVSSMSTTTAISIAHQQPSVSLLAPVLASDADVQSSQLRREMPTASTSGRPHADVQQQTASSGSVHSPEFDASFAGEAETMFTAGQGTYSCQTSVLVIATSQFCSTHLVPVSKISTCNKSQHLD